MTIADTTADARPPKLPFWRTVGRAYAAPFVNFGSLVGAAWLWLLVLTPVLLVISWFLAPMQAELFAKLGTDPDAGTPSLEFQLISILQQLVILPAIASIAVAWHRLILNQERPSSTYFRFDRSVWLYAAFLLATTLFFNVLSNLPQMIASAQGTRLPLWASMLPGVLTIAAAFVICRLSLVLPPIALGRTDIGLGEAWRATHRNTWRLFWGPIFCLILLVAPAIFLFLYAGAERMTATVIMTAVSLISILGGVIGVGFLSFAYQHFFEGGDRRAD